MNRLNSKHAKQRIVAYVESYDDVFFWRTLLGPLEKKDFFFEIMLPSKNHRLERGKKAVLMNLITERAGKHMIACVDADYDYLLQDTTRSSRSVTGNPYVFHTYAYSIENLQCFAPTLHGVSVMVTLNDHQVFDYEAYLRRYSQIIFPLFVWNIMFYRALRHKDFTMANFLNTIDVSGFSLFQADKMLLRLSARVNRKIRCLQEENAGFKAEYVKVRKELNRLGVNADNTYLYIQGHHLFERVVVPMMKEVCGYLIREREKEISAGSVHRIQRYNELSNYNHSIGDIEKLLKKNTGYIFSGPFRQIQSDVLDFLKEQGLAGSDLDDNGQ